MTENERVLRDIIIDGNGFDYDESIPQSIFEEIQQYRELGAVEEIAYCIKQSEEEFNMLMEYRNIGTIEEFKALKEKSVAKKPVVKGVMGFDGEEEYHCPNCNQKLMY